jgi:hypothetical protein
MQKEKWWQSIAPITILLLFVTAAVLGGAYFVSTEKAGLEAYLPIIMIVGVVGLLLTLAAVVGIFAYFGLALRGEALGLPDGSVRAIIALSLVLLFGIVTIFMYSDLGKRGQVQTATDITAEQHKTFLDRIPSPLIILDQQLTTPSDPKDAKFKITYRDVANPISEDFAKQLLVLLGTLVTSVASFYFGTAAVSSEHPATRAGDTGDMNLTGIDPETVPPSGKQRIAINGSNLGKVNDVTFRQGKDTIYAEVDKVEDAKVTCSFSADGKQPGKWDVIVSDGTNLKKLPARLEIKT